MLISRYDESVSIFNGAIRSAAMAVVKPTNAGQVSKYVLSLRDVAYLVLIIQEPSGIAESTTSIYQSNREEPEYTVNP